MLAEREYQSRSRHGLPISATAWIAIALVVVFVAQTIDNSRFHSPAQDYLGLSVAGLKRGYVYQFLTFQFLHIGIWHLLFNLIGLWCFGRFVESVCGKGRFLLAYFGAGAAGGLLQVILALLFPRYFSGITFGASAGVCGLIAIFARMQPDAEVSLYAIIP